MKAFRVRVAAEHEDWASAVLWEEGTAGVEVQSADGPCQLLAYFGDHVDARDIEAALAGMPGAEVEAVDVPAVDWVAHFREHFRGLAAPPFFIAPVWDVPSGELSRVLVVDPGRAFGTGTHETTRLCLTALASLAGERGMGRLLDVGTGSGILAIAASRLGARLAVGVDVDAESIESASRHAALNRVSVRLVRGDGGAGFRPASFDTVVANISAPLLRERRAELQRLLAPSGTLVLSGLLAADVPDLRAAYSPCGASSTLEDGEWAALIVRRAP
jgi:ribosomal protein L11 methyltransferase